MEERGAIEQRPVPHGDRVTGVPAVVGAESAAAEVEGGGGGPDRSVVEDTRPCCLHRSVGAVFSGVGATAPIFPKGKKKKFLRSFRFAKIGAQPQPPPAFRLRRKFLFRRNKKAAWNVLRTFYGSKAFAKRRFLLARRKQAFEEQVINKLITESERGSTTPAVFAYGDGQFASSMQGCHGGTPHAFCGGFLLRKKFLGFAQKPHKIFGLCPKTKRRLLALKRRVVRRFCGGFLLRKKFLGERV